MNKEKKYTRREFYKLMGAAYLGTASTPFFLQCNQSTRVLDKGIPILPRSSPETQGVHSEGIKEFVDAANASGLEWHSFMLLRHGHIISEGWWAPFAPEYKHTLYSLSKSFTSTAVGFAVSEGLLDLSDQVISFFPENLPAQVSSNLESMNIRHLLTMNTGHETDSFGAILQKYQEPWVPTFLAHPVEREPGTHFVYDTGATFMLSAIVQKVSGISLEVYLKERLFDKLVINDFEWEKSPENINAGGFGLRVNTEAIARFGQLYLEMGNWGGQDLLSKDWIMEATSKQTESHPGDSQWSQGYGYQFWKCKPPGIYRGDGAYGQFCIVMPEQDAVLAITSESFDMGKSMDIAFEHLLPAFSDNVLVENPRSYENLKQMTANLVISRPDRLPLSTANNWFHSGRKFTFQENEFGIGEILFRKDENKYQLEIARKEGISVLEAGIDQWLTSEGIFQNPCPVFFRTTDPSKVAASAGWSDSETLEFRLKFVEAIHGDKYVCRFKGNVVEIEFLNSVAENDPNDRNMERRKPIKGVHIQ